MQRKKIWAKVLMTLLAVLTSVNMWALTPRPGDSWDESTKTLTVNSNPGDHYGGDEDIEFVIIGDGLTKLGDWAFYSCNNLQGVTIGKGLMYIGVGAFTYCPSLTTITVKDGNAAFKVEDNVLLSKNGETLVAYPDGKGAASYTIPSGVTTIATYVFAGSKVSSIQLSSSVTTIGEFAFEECNQLASFTVDEGNATFKATGDGVLLSKNGETLVAYPGGKTEGSYNIPSSVTTIGYGAFEGCQNVTGITFPEGLTSIDDYAFWNCDQLTSVTIGENVKSIGDYAFYDCGDLATINGCEGVEHLGESAFGCTAWNDDICDDEKTPCLIYVGKVAYYYRGKMPANTEIILNDGTTEIDAWCFSWQENLKSVTIPASVKNIDESAFENCIALEEVNGCEGVEHLGNCALTSTKWDDDLEAKTDLGYLLYLGKVAYKYVGTMPANTAIAIEDGKTEICYKCFDGQENLKSITIPNSVTSIGDYSFYEGTGLKSITLSNSVTSIGNYSFYGCTGLKSITLSNSVTSIGEDAFDSCTGLTSITIPASVTSIGCDAFKDCTNMTDVYVLGNAATLAWDDYQYNDFMSGRATKCHVTDQAAFEAKWATGKEEDDVNVTFVGDLAVFEDAADNTAAIAALKGETKCVVLNGRTLKGGKWNTLCVPFALTNAMLTDSESPLYGATIREFNDYKNDGTNVTVTFIKWLPMGDKDFDAGFPLLVWIEGEDIVNPVFKDVEIVSEDPQIHDLNDGDKFRGTFKPAYLDEGDTQKLFLQNNTLYYPATASKVNAFRAYFDLKSNVPTTIGGAKTFIDFVDEEATAIEDVTTDNGQQTTDTWYTINGVKLNGEPTEKGVYIYNGHKYIVK